MPVVGAEATAAERGVLSLSDTAWEEARRRAEVIGPLAGMGSVSHDAADEAGEQLGLSRRQVYVLVKRWRQGSGLVTDLAVGRSSGGRGAGRLPEAVESVIREVLTKRYMSRQRPSLAVVHGDVVRACKARGLVAPARNTLAARIAMLHPAAVAQASEGDDAARRLRGAAGTRRWETTRPTVSRRTLIVEASITLPRAELPAGLSRRAGNRHK